MGDREGQSDSKFKGGIGRNSLIIQFITRNNSPGRHPIALIFLISYFDSVDPPAPGDSISQTPRTCTHYTSPLRSNSNTPTSPPRTPPEDILCYKTNTQKNRA